MQLSKLKDSTEVLKSLVRMQTNLDRRHFIGGSDARIIIGQDEKALIRLWQEKRGEVGPEDLSANLDEGARLHRS
jgi:predicted phage-related endonuclease